MLQAKDIMSAKVVMVEGTATVAEAVQTMRDNKVRTLIVDRRGVEDAYGIVTYRDIVYKVIAKGLDPREVRVHEIMTKPLVVINKDLDIKYVARLFANTGLSRAPVIFDGKVQGIVSVSDIVEKGV
ncbi:MAG: CBS domain-containing protein [Armatimonadetes bacterium]|nr:CBS domain-containing protein [Armatimonadota bacterium]